MGKKKKERRSTSKQRKKKESFTSTNDKVDVRERAGGGRGAAGDGAADGGAKRCRVAAGGESRLHFGGNSGEGRWEVGG